MAVLVCAKHIISVIKDKRLRMEEGFLTLLSILIVSAIGAIIATSLILLGLGSSRTSFTLEQSEQARSLANACTEEALQKIRESTSFSGSGSLALGQGICTYLVTNIGGQNRQINATGTIVTVIRKVRAIINRVIPTINITTWEEIL